MDIPGVTQATNTTQSSGAQALNQINEDYTTFLQLLTAQISNQDPLEPMDSTTFVTQLAQLSQVEQAAQTNVLLEDLGAQLDSISLTASATLVGQEASFATNTLVLDETGAEATYKLSQTADTVSVEIFGPTGQLVRTITGLPGAAGTEQALTWDGRTETGQNALQGTYQLRVRAFDDQGDPVEATVFRDAEIKEVSLSAGQIFYLVDGDELIAADSVPAVR